MINITDVSPWQPLKPLPCALLHFSLSFFSLSHSPSLFYLITLTATLVNFAFFFFFFLVFKDYHIVSPTLWYFSLIFLYLLLPIFSFILYFYFFYFLLFLSFISSILHWTCYFSFPFATALIIIKKKRNSVYFIAVLSPTPCHNHRNNSWPSRPWLQP